MTKAKIYSCVRILIVVASSTAAVFLSASDTHLDELDVFLIPLLVLIAVLALIDEIVTRVNVAIHRALKQRNGSYRNKAAVR